jgi:putative ABC transport system permease protein
MACGSTWWTARFTGGLLADTAKATSHGWEVGCVVRTVGVDGTELAVPVAGTYRSNAAVGPIVLPLSDLDRLGGEKLDRWVFLHVADGADTDEVRAAAEAVLADYPVVTVKHRAQFTEEQQASVGQILMLINAMLVLSVLIAVLGIVNTLALSVMERTREVGLLRAPSGCRGGSSSRRCGWRRCSSRSLALCWAWAWASRSARASSR